MAVGTEIILVDPLIAAAKASNMDPGFCCNMTVTPHMTIEALITFAAELTMAQSGKL